MNLNTEILAACRTPLGAFQGTFSEVPAVSLGAVVVRELLARAGLEGGDVDDVLLGAVLQSGQGQAPVRQATLRAGLPAKVRTTSVNRVCGSGMQAVLQASLGLAAGLSEVVVAGGMENMSRAPYLLPQARTGCRLGHHRLVDSLVHDGLWDPHSDQHMGKCAEATAALYGFSRGMQDAFALESYDRALAQMKRNGFADEIVPVQVTEKRGNVIRVDRDEGPTRLRPDKIAHLKPAFDPEGTITAANASSLNDGAAGLLLARGDSRIVRERPSLGRIVGFGSHAQDPKWFTTAPVQAARLALAAAGWKADDVDLWEVNEAFAVVPLAFMREMDLAPDRVNVRGGAIALGHPIGCSGARIIVTLLAALRAAGRRRGVAAICIGGGEGLAVCVETAA